MRQRTYKINLDTLKRLMLEKGWIQYDLADKAAISPRTINSIMSREGILMVTLKRVAAALNVPILALLNETPSQTEEKPNNPKPKTFKLTLTLDIPYEDFNEAGELIRFLEIMSLMKKKIAGKSKCMK